MIVRPAIENDLSILALLWQERIALLQQTDFYFTPLPDAQQHWQAQARLWLDEQKIAFFVAERDEIPIGYIVGEVQSSPAGLSPKFVGIVSDMALDLHRYHGGAGRNLVNALKNWFVEQSITLIHINIPAHYPVEQAFWQSIGAKTRFNDVWIKI